MSKQHISLRSNITCSTNCKYRTAASLFTLETWFVSDTYIIVNTLHKGDNKYDYENNNNSNNNNNFWPQSKSHNYTLMMISICQTIGYKSVLQNCFHGGNPQINFIFVISCIVILG